MAVIIISRALIALFSAAVAWCGLTWHIGFTIQNRFTWGMRGSYFPLLQRILLNFIWTAVQCKSSAKCL
jgi:NCS1 family nucleobase:cation symporter-1